ncbi:MAG: TolC family protein [Ruminiclostridium sp.]
MIIALLPLQLPGVSYAAGENGAADAANGKSTSQPIKLTLEAAFDKVINNSSELKQMDLSIKKLWRVADQNMGFTTMDANVTKKLENLDNYVDLFDRKAKSDRGEKTELLNTNELNELLDYSEAFGDIPPPYSKEIMFDRYTQSSAFPQYSNWLQVQKLKSSQDITKSTLKESVRSMYYNVLYLQDLQVVMKQSLETMEKQYKILQLQYEKGLVSELDTYQCQVSLDKKKRELKKQERNIENAEMLLKNKCGIPVSQEIDLESTELPAAAKLLSYDTYYKKACESRNEIVNSKLELTVLTRELDILNGYKKNPYSFDKMDLAEQIENAELSVSQGSETVLGDIQWAYADVTSSQLNMSISKKNADNAKANYTNMETRYAQGQVNLLELWNARDSADTAAVNYRKAQRDFACASNKMDLASGLGPKYRQG